VLPIPHALVVQKDKKIRLRALPVELIGAAMIYSMIVPLVFLDAWTTVYQWAYFGLKGIPKVNRHEYIILDRLNLRKLSWLQRVNCAYCDYANGLMAWAEAVTNTTEIYSCAIKHSSPRFSRPHEKGFYPFEKYR
jgi:hypothetical protein